MESVGVESSDLDFSIVQRGTMGGQGSGVEKRQVEEVVQPKELTSSRMRAKVGGSGHELVSGHRNQGV